jgi:hypothetical protein
VETSVDDNDDDKMTPPTIMNIQTVECGKKIFG